MTLLPLALFLAFQPAEPPQTVNGQVLGRAEDHATKGPARVCLVDTSIEVRDGETAWLSYLGIHWGGVRITGSGGDFSVREGDHWAAPKRAQLFTDRRSRTIARTRRKGRTSYLIYGPSSYAADRDTPRVWVESDSMSSARLEAVLDRIDIRPERLENCKRRFLYGWEFLLGEEDAKE